MNNKKRGFTLIELIISVVALAIAGGLIFVVVFGGGGCQSIYH